MASLFKGFLGGGAAESEPSGKEIIEKLKKRSVGPLNEIQQLLKMVFFPFFFQSGIFNTAGGQARCSAGHQGTLQEVQERGGHALHAAAPGGLAQRQDGCRNRRLLFGDAVERHGDQPTGNQ